VQDAFILGAGFSIAIDPLVMPSTDELGARAVDALRSVHSNKVQVHSDVCDGVSCDRPVLIDGELPAPTFEIWLSRLVEPQPYLHPQENERNHALFVDLSGLIAADIQGDMQSVCQDKSPPDWLVRLVTAWHERQADVITFNYDTLVEATFQHLRLPDPRRPDQEPLGYRQIGPAVVPLWLDVWGGRHSVPGATFNYWKLHGSVHWYWDAVSRAADSIVESGVPYLWSGESSGAYRSPPGKEPLLIPPTAVKTGFFDNPLIRQLWHGAFLGLTGADRIFVLGYSLPEVDLLTASLLAAGVHTRQIWVVNPDATVVDRWQALKLPLVSPEFHGLDNPIPGFVDWYTST
jgi:hypothetical protein